MARAQPKEIPGLSNAANALIRLFVEQSKNATKLDPNFSVEGLAGKLSLSEDDVKDCVFELQSFLANHRDHIVHAKDELFVSFDKYWMPWNPEDDALHLATRLVNDKAFPRHPEQQAKVLEWPARRLNPAIAYLANRDHVKALTSNSGGPWAFASVLNTDATRRFVKSRG